MSPAESTTTAESSAPTLLQSACRRDGRYLNPVPTRVGGIKLLFKIAPRFFFGARARWPRRPPGPFRTDRAIYATPPPSGLRITWFGHSSSLVEIDGARILLDPVWEERASPSPWGGPRRFFPAPLRLEDLPPLDAVVISHDHYDHLGAATIRTLAGLPAAAGARWVTPLGVAPLLQPLGVRPERCVELDWMSSTRAGAIELTAVPTRHFSGRGLFNRFSTLWACFVLRGPRHSVYFGSDSGEWPGFGEIGARFGPFDVSMLEIGAWNPLWSQIHLGPEAAVRSFRAMGGQGLLMPIHWGLFDLALHHWTEPIAEISEVEGLKLWSPTPGVPTDVRADQEVRSDWWCEQAGV